MSLEIGVNEGWRLGADSKVTDKGGFMLEFVKGTVIASALALLESEEPDAETYSMLLFPPNMEDYKTKEPRKAIEIMKDIKTDYKRLYTIFNLYITKDELKKLFPIGVITEGIGLTEENQLSLLTQETTVNKMFTNLAEAAIKVINEQELFEKEEFRIKVLRQSPKKAFPRLTYKPDFSDWIELMTIPKEQSKVAFTKFELSKGYDDATVAADVIDPTDVDDVFDEDEIPSAQDDEVIIEE